MQVKEDISLEVKSWIKDNLNPRFELRPYQLEALTRFQVAANEEQKNLLFHMATGSGKTMIMAGCILHLYKLGYRNFIFFVNSSTIIKKTKDNFLNPLSSKYLFSKSINIDTKNIRIREVQNFENVHKDDINIVFTTIQGLHSRLNAPKENNLSFEEFGDHKIVLISDEAHHINAETKKGKLNKTEAESKLSWESTVTRIYDSNPDNYLLEFTATVDFNNAFIKEKYQDKLLFDYSLKQFRLDKFSKEVKVLQADLSPFQRALQALILSEYRKRVFEEYGLIKKPVVLFKSKTISESQSFYDLFIREIKALKSDDLGDLKGLNHNTVVGEALQYFEKHLSLENFVIVLQEAFGEHKCIKVDSKSDTIENQMVLNSLEDEDNHYRAIFAVDKLNEGWDVLNLFDIVRLYNSPAKASKKVSKTTMSEAQLIGRGARYCPFRLDDQEPLFQRKYDDSAHDLKICEELYYHATYNPAYISELGNALQDIGLYKSDIETSTEFIESEKERRQQNDIISNSNRKIINQQDQIAPQILNKKRILKVLNKVIESTDFESVGDSEIEILVDCKLKDIKESIIRKAMSKLPFYHFNTLIKYYPNLESISTFIHSEKYLSKLEFQVVTSTPELSIEDQLKVCTKLLSEISIDIRK